jgi:hypothetical protein
MEEILHQLIGGLSVYPTVYRFQPSKVVQDFFHPQYHAIYSCILAGDFLTLPYANFH